jgi:hypothetical protein
VWLVAHPSNTAARRILVTYSFHVAVSGVGIPEPPGIKMNNFILCPVIIVFRMNNPSSFIQWSLFFLCVLPPLAECFCKQKCRFRKLCGLITSQESILYAINRDGAYSMTTCSKIHDMRARSTTYEQDQCVCVILHISSWRYGRVVTLFWCINDDCNLCVCDFAYLIMKIWLHCNLVLMYQWWL